MELLFDIKESAKYGVVLTVRDAEIADHFDDYLAEQCYVFTEIKFYENHVDFYFGQASCIEKVNYLVELYTRFRPDFQKQPT
jgi:hypothetical protein